MATILMKKACIPTLALAVLGCGGLVGGSPTFRVNPKYGARLDQPFAPGARVELALWSDERNLVLGPTIPPMSNIRGTSSDPTVAQYVQLHDMGYVNGLGEDLTGKGIHALGPGITTLCIYADLKRGSHTECFDIEVQRATWSYTYEGEPLTTDLEVPKGTKVRLGIHATGPDGRALSVRGADFDDDFTWVTLGNNPTTGVATCQDALTLAHSKVRILCPE